MTEFPIELAAARADAEREQYAATTARALLLRAVADADKRVFDANGAYRRADDVFKAAVDEYVKTVVEQEL